MNDVNHYVDEMLDGLTAAVSTVRCIEGTQVIVRSALRRKGGVVTGGGSGHEPAHAGDVGDEMLDAAVSGEVFTSPTPAQVLESLRAVDQGMGVFLVIRIH